VKVYYLQAVEELFKIMKLMSTKSSDSTEEDVRAISTFKRTMMQMFLGFLDARSMWQTLIRSQLVIHKTNFFKESDF